MSSVAVKNPDTSAPGALDRLHLGILAGVVYLIGSVAIVFQLLPWLWGRLMASLGTAAPGPALSTTLLILLGFAVAVGLAYLGRRLVGPTPAPGLKAGIFTTLVTLLVVLLLTRWASIYFEGWAYDTRSLSPTVGIVLTAAVGLVLLVLAARFIFLAPSFGSKMVAFEEQGWFSTISYKRSQGVRVRRGTILGILLLGGCGVYSLSHSTALLGNEDWALNVPFTGQARVTALKDAAVVFAGAAPKDAEGNPEVPFTTDLGTFREKNNLLKSAYVKVEDPGDAADQLSKGQVVTKEDFERIAKPYRDKKEGGKAPELSLRGPELATATISYEHLTLLPHVRYSLLILLSALSLWFAWRIVNWPAFADFLIATEAELNKVSWTTRRRLVQDTIVVLVTVILFTVFLFVVDVAWGKFLSWERIGVLKMPTGEQGAQAQKPDW